MLDCWQIDADERPSFAEVAANLDHLMDEARQHKMVSFDLTNFFLQKNINHFFCSSPCWITL